jgi:hypothetical protein
LFSGDQLIALVGGNHTFDGVNYDIDLNMALSGLPFDIHRDVYDERCSLI